MRASGLDAVRRQRLALLGLVVWVLVVCGLTVARGMDEVWPFWITVSGVVVLAAVVFVGLARVVGGPGWRRLLGSARPGPTRGDLLVFLAVGLTILIENIVADAARGDLALLVLGGLLAPVPGLAVVLVPRWWRSRARRDDGPGAD